MLADTKPSKAGRRLKSVIRSLHAWLGAICSLFILSVSISGGAIAFSSQLLNFETAAFPAVKARPVNKRVDIDKLSMSAKQATQTTFIPLGYLGPNAEIATNVDMIYGLSDTPENGGEVQIVTFDPHSYEAIGSFYLERTLTHHVIDFHYNLLVGSIGATSVAVVGLLMVALSISAVYLWWPVRLSIFRKATRLSFVGNVFNKSFNLHSVVGFWSIAFVITWSLTGVYWSKPDWGPAFIKPKTTVLSEEILEQFRSADCGSTISVGAAAEVALDKNTESWLIEAEFPAPWQPYSVLYLGKQGDVDKKDGDTRVWASSNCLELTQQKEVSGLEHIGAINSSIHSGETFGALRAPLILIVALILSMLSLTGLIIWYRRFIT